MEQKGLLFLILTLSKYNLNIFLDRVYIIQRREFDFR